MTKDVVVTMRVLRVIAACAVVGLVTGFAGRVGDPQALAGSHAAEGPRPVAEASDLIAIVGVTLKTDMDAVYTVRPDGSGHEQLSLPAALPTEAVAWSPDGKYLAVDAGGIYIVGADGRGFRQLTPSGLNTNADVAWSPDGKWIAFTGYAYGYDSAAYVIRPDGTGLHQVLKRFEVDSLAWGPHGQLAILGSPHHPAPPWRHASPAPTGVWTVAVSGAHARLVASRSRVLPDLAGLSTWSPDGHWLLIQSGNSLISVPAAGGQPRVIMRVPPQGYVTAAAWSPGGNVIIVAVNPAGSDVTPVRFYRVPANGGRLTPVDFPPMRYVSSLAWQRAS